MALQSSGQISLSNIATEFGGSAPHALSEYYGSDTVTSSGQIAFSNFYGTSNITYNATISNANRSQKAGTNQRGYSNGNSANGTGNVSFGSISNQSGIGSNIIALYFHDDSPIPQGFGGADQLRLRFNANISNWTQMKLSLNGASEVTYYRSQASTNTASQYNWSNAGGITSSGTTTVRFI